VKQEKTLIKYKKLQKNLKKMKKVAIGFSGGIDSSFLLKVASDTLNDNVLAITVTSPAHTQKGINNAKKIAKNFNVKHKVVKLDLTQIKCFKNNTSKRCYHCKKKIFSTIKRIARKNNIKYVIDASNIDDLSDYRPGMKALKELKIISPLVEVGLTKKEIRELSKQIGLDTWDKPSETCLATRFPYGVKIKKSRLEQVEKAESYIHLLGINIVRVRYHNETARIEAKKEDFNIILKNHDKIIRYFKEIGFKYITLDLNGYQSGVFDKEIKKYEKNTK